MATLSMSTTATSSALSCVEENEEECFEYVPQIKCSRIARNGAVSIEIENMEDLIKNGKFDTAHNKCFQLIFRTISADETEQECNKWNARDIRIGNVSGGQFDLKFPIMLNNYDIQFTLRAINIKTEEWMDFARPQIVHIPSMLTDTSYNEGDMVLFRRKNKIYATTGRILEVLPDDTFRIVYALERSENDEDEDGDENEVKLTTEIICRTKVFRRGTEQMNEINLTDSAELDKQLMIKRDDYESIAVFNSILEHYEDDSLMHCLHTYGFGLSLVYWRPIARLVTKHIFDFLYAAMAQFEWKINCIVNPYNDGKLVMGQVRQYAIKTYLEGIAKGVEDCGKLSHCFDFDYQCDWCFGAMNQFEFMFNCSAECTERHDICMQCVYNVINLGTQLELWLGQILEDELDTDCINTIVDYVVGRPICIHQS